VDSLCTTFFLFWPAGEAPHNFRLTEVDTHDILAVSSRSHRFSPCNVGVHKVANEFPRCMRAWGQSLVDAAGG
jgi:hypothetical protein